jgi:hypothetical protein
MKNLTQVLKDVDTRLNKIQPNTMDEFLEVVHQTEGMEKYGTSFSIVQYMGAIQGVRVGITGRSKTHILPSKKGYSYGVFKGLEKYIQAGFRVETPEGEEI